MIDGRRDQIPLPDDFADVLITSHALGWQLADELAEFERVVKADGMIVHCPGTAVHQQWEDPVHVALVAPEWGYACATFAEADGMKRKYWKRVTKASSSGRRNIRAKRKVKSPMCRSQLGTLDCVHPAPIVSACLRRKRLLR